MIKISLTEKTQVEEPLLVGGTYSPHRQVLRLFIQFLVRWILTAAICGAFTVVLKQYDKQVYMQDGNTHVYNSVTAGLTICLSLNLDSSLNSFAAALKWVILAGKPFRPKVFDLILAFDSSKLNPIKLLWRGRSWRLRVICVVWLFIAIAAQIGTALIGLTYSVVPLSPDSTDFPTPRGNGTTASFTQIGAYDGYADPTPFPTQPEDSVFNLTVQRSNAFAYGVGAINSGIYIYDGPEDLAFHSAAYNETSMSYTSPIANFPAWGRNSLTSWNVIGRAVENWASCSDSFIPEVDSDEDTTTVTFSGYNGTQTLTISQSPLDYMTYISDTALSCGPRCTQLYVVLNTTEATEMFVCNSTVYLMYDYESGKYIYNGSLSMPDTQARILAGGIGWGDVNVDGTLDDRTLPDRFQASSFPNGSYWAPWYWPDSTFVSDFFVAHFAAAAIGVIDQYGISNNYTNLLLPGVASQLDVKWTYSVLVFALIPSLQALLALLTLFVIYRTKVPIHEDSPLAIATLLKHVVSHISTESLPSGSRIAKNMEHQLIYARSLTDEDKYEIRVTSNEGGY
ncbi:hypothetical protein F4821DRAFT_90213 [Hypoxylon rubiginosum]|uniref:Uncharacterized protein n=1 Tax=Hypoxylon rubiginosum TaxID=110542 RepID=A0ACC0D7I8_9PEZI|nr:hypothetical protein F4821DRAFT_90213 [Hypoxylon rubiginosum]